jgi:predicted unusual protein kinase regulating ubiquinone biosynthesis (AarF/ABC1/UbiB family)
MTTMTTTIGGLGRDGGDGDAAADDGEGASGDDDDGDDAEGRIRRSSRSSRSRSSRRREEEMEIELSTRLRSSLATLGPTFVKAGQQLSIRPDLVSPIVLRELQRLCDAVPPFDDGVAMRVLAEELTSSSSSSSSSLRRMSNGGDDDEDAIRTSKKIVEKEDVDAAILRVFEEMPILVASASLGQVYKATLRSNDGGDNDASTGCGATTTGLTSSTSASSAWGREVAIKIQRPDILETVSLDLYLLVSYGKMMDKLCSLMTEQIPYHEMFLNGFANGAYMEMNYVHEAENQIYFRNELHSRFHGNNNGNCSSNNNNSSNGGGDGHSSSMKVGANEKYNMNIGGMLSLLRGRLIRAGKRKKGKVVERVIVPEVYERYTTERILVTEWIDGTPLARAPPEQIRALIPVGVELFLVQLLDIGRFHGEGPVDVQPSSSMAIKILPMFCSS